MLRKGFSERFSARRLRVPYRRIRVVPWQFGPPLAHGGPKCPLGPRRLGACVTGRRHAGRQPVDSKCHRRSIRTIATMPRYGCAPRSVPSMSLLPDYSTQARTYDETRAASAPVLAALRDALAGAPGRRLADIGGGTGNYALALAHEGWEPVVVDLSPPMLALAERKGLATLGADAECLPLEDESFDAAVLVSMLHHLAYPAAALAEARRILRPDGRMAVMAFTREDIQGLWFLDYFPSTRAWMHASHAPLSELVAQLPGARREQIVLDDLKDASLAALAAHPEKVLEPSWRAQASYFERLGRDSPRELEAGLRRLSADVVDGSAPCTPGRASVLAWTKAPA